MITVFNEIIQIARLNTVREIMYNFERKHEVYKVYNESTYNSIMNVLRDFETRYQKGFYYGEDVDKETETKRTC